MNLLYSPNLSNLSSLISQCENFNNKFLIVIEHDGEVLLKNDWEKTVYLLPKYKFYISGLHGSKHLGTKAAKNLKYINQLHQILLFCWEKNIKGFVDINNPSFIQSLVIWIEMKTLSNIRNYEYENISREKVLVYK